MKIQLDLTQRQNIWNSFVNESDTQEYLEILAVQLGHIDQISQRLSNGAQNPIFTQICRITLNEEQIKIISEQIDYYADYGNLLLENISKNVPALNSVLKYMTENRQGYRLSLEEVIPKFFEIKDKLEISESTLLEQLNDWERHKDSISADNIQQIITDAQFFQYSVVTKNDLTDYLNKTVVEALSTIDSDALQQSHYWNTVIQNLIDTDFLKSLPDNLTDLGKKYLDDIAASRLSIPNSDDTIYKLIGKLDRRKTKETITNIRNQICNNIADYGIDANKFIFLHEWFEKQGDLSSRAGDVCQYILSPVVNNADCLDIIVQNADFYVDIVNAAQADTFKSSISNKLSTSTDENLISFAKRIGVEKEEQE